MSHYGILELVSRKYPQCSDSLFAYYDGSPTVAWQPFSLYGLLVVDECLIGGAAFFVTLPFILRVCMLRTAWLIASCAGVDGLRVVPVGGRHKRRLVRAFLNA